MKLVRVGMLFALMLAPLALGQQPQAHFAPKAEEKPVGYDIASCTSENFYVVHFKIVGDDLSLVSYMDEPGPVNTLPEPQFYKFVKEDTNGKHYTSMLDKVEVELIFKFEKHTAIGVQKHDGEDVGLIFGIQADGSRLSENAVEFSAVCQGLRDDVKGTTPKSDEPKKKSSGEYDAPNSHFGRNEPIKQI